MGVTIWAVTVGTVLLVNIALIAWATNKYGLEEGFGILQHGDCKETTFLTVWLHLVINTLSTLLLSANNYTMQCISSPTREEIDKAHARNIWMDVGVPSLRNLRRIPWPRIILCWLLALSGIPLHLLYNSAVFSTLATLEYTVYLGSDSLFKSDASFNWSKPIPRSNNHTTMQYLQDASTWNRLSNYECINNYSQAFALHRDLLTVTSAQLPNGALAEMLDGNCTSLNGSTPLDNACLDHQWICQSQYYTLTTTVDHWYHINNTNISTVPKFGSIDAALNNATNWVLIDGSRDTQSSTVSASPQMIDAVYSSASPSC